MPEAKTFEESQRMFSLPTQAEVHYNPAGQQGGKACSSCRYFLRDGWDGQPRCHLIQNWPEPIEPNGLCDRHEVKTETVDLGTPIAVVLVDPPLSLEDSAEMALSVPKGLVERVKGFISSLTPAPVEIPAFAVFKAKNGRKAWVARHTGKWVDREGEILSEKSHEAYVERVQKGVTPAPELWMWHAKGTKHGQAVTVWKSGGFVLAAGYFDDTPAGNKAFEYYQKHSGSIKLSHMFHYPREAKINGVYHEYNTVEITTLPDGAEAFPYTSFTEIQTMAIPDAARSMISEALGDDVLRQAEAADSKAQADTKTLEAQGVASKGYDKYDGSEVLSAAQKVEQALSALPQTETRLKAVEDGIKALPDLLETVKQLVTTVKELTEKVDTAIAAEGKALERSNALEKKLAELTDIQAPSSQSNETLLNDREKSLIGDLMKAAKQTDQKSLVDQLLDGQPGIHS